jgi:hypothetical protein
LVSHHFCLGIGVSAILVTLLRTKIVTLSNFMSCHRTACRHIDTNMYPTAMMTNDRVFGAVPGIYTQLYLCAGDRDEHHACNYQSACQAS